MSNQARSKQTKTANNVRMITGSGRGEHSNSAKC
jgi:hypothetical protein